MDIAGDEASIAESGKTMRIETSLFFNKDYVAYTNRCKYYITFWMIASYLIVTKSIKQGLLLAKKYWVIFGAIPTNNKK